jgi:hypothetical protein
MPDPRSYGWFPTSVSLDEQTKALANQKNNFSRWVRQALLREASLTAGHQTAEAYRYDGRCNPMTNLVCSICWPDGKPARQDWITYVNALRDGLEPTVPEPAFGHNPISGGWAIDCDDPREKQSVETKIATDALNHLWLKVVAVILVVEILIL